MFHVKHFNDSVPLIRAHLLRADAMPPRIRLRVFPYAAHTIEDGFMQASVYFRVDTPRAKIPCAQVQLPNIGIMLFSIRREFFIIHSFTPPLQYVTLAYFHLYNRLTRKCTFRRVRSGFCKDSLFNVHAALLTMCAAVMPYRHFTELKRRIFRPVRWCYFIRCTDKSKSCFALLCCFCACFQALSPLLPCENCKNTENKEIFTFSGKCCTKNKRTFCAI